MNYHRRKFLKLSATLGTGLALGPVTNALASHNFKGINKNFGLQLYTLRDVLPQDPKGVLKKVASYGYTQLETYTHVKLGMYWGMKNTEFKKYVEDLGMRLISGHCKIEKDFERQADEAAEIGMKYLVCASLDNNLFPRKEPELTIDQFKKAAAKFNDLGRLCKNKGLRFAYHNHDVPFKAINGIFPENVLLQNTDASLVDFEMDIYWVVTAGQDPIEWLDKHPNRFKLCHIKDRKKNTPLSVRDASTELGKGEIDFKKILKEAEKKGVKYYIVEQELYEHTTPLLAAKEDAQYLKHFKV